MQLVEQHCIHKSNSRYAVIDEAAFKSKNLYNAALYEVRQAFIHHGIYLNYQEMQRLMQSHEAYQALPAKVAQQVLMLLDKNWISFFEACEAYKQDPSQFTGRPKLPKYKHKTKGRNLLVYTMQAISGGQTGGKKTLQRGIIKPSQLPIAIRTRQKPGTINQIRIVPRKGFYVVEVVYEQEQRETAVDRHVYAGIDLGMNNLVALTSNKAGFVPVVVNGRPVKSMNQFYNKRKAELQSKLGTIGTPTQRMERITNKRNRRIDHYMHTTSRWIIDLLVSEGIGTLVIGKNEGWKRDANMGTQTNQNFVQIPHARFIQMLCYKAKLVGITVKLTEESYTSKASFLDHDPLPVFDPNNEIPYVFSGKRVKRGLYRASDGRYINADVNGSYNIIKKVAPNTFGPKGVEDGKGNPLVVHPVRITLANPKTTSGK